MQKQAASPETIASRSLRGQPTHGLTNYRNTTGLSIGIVIPVFGHSRLVAEAIASALAQDHHGPLHIVVVVDGDADAETLATVRAFAAKSAAAAPANEEQTVPTRSYSLIFRPNGRLPAARNTGIRYLMEIVPELFAIYLLDADNRLSTHSIRTFAQKLVQDDGAAWAFPDVSFFGLSWGAAGADVRATALEYSPFRHLIGNICEAGSMVRTSVFREGIFFDETFNRGYEDWEFWLQCLGHGHRGVRVADAGFQYRRRADSMLADADRISPEIRSDILAKHHALFKPASIRAAYGREFYPILFINHDNELVLVSVDGRTETLSADELAGRLIEAFDNFHYAYLPRFIVTPIAGEVAPVVDGETMAAMLKYRDKEVEFFLDHACRILDVQSELACYRLTPMRAALSGRFQNATPQTMAAVAIVTELISKLRAVPVSAHVDRRYAGPASFRIDAFIDDAEAQAVQSPSPITAAAALPRCLIVHDSGERAQHVIEELGRDHKVTETDLDRLAGHVTGNDATVLYNGAHLHYRRADAVFLFLAEISDAFETIYVVDDLSCLFHIGQWKRPGTEIELVVTRPLQRDAQMALQAVEHSLASIYCQASNMTALHALGIPSRKIKDVAVRFPNLRGVPTVKEAG